MLYLKSPKNYFVAYSGFNSSMIVNSIRILEGHVLYNDGNNILALMNNDIITNYTEQGKIGFGDTPKQALASVVVAKYFSKSGTVKFGSDIPKGLEYLAKNENLKDFEGLRKFCENGYSIDFSVNISSVKPFKITGYVLIHTTYFGGRTNDKPFKFPWSVTIQDKDATPVIDIDDVIRGLGDIKLGFDQAPLTDDEKSMVIDGTNSQIIEYVDKYLREPSEGQENLLLKPFKDFFEMNPKNVQDIPMSLFNTVSKKHKIPQNLLDKILSKGHGAVMGYEWEVTDKGLHVEKIASTNNNFTVWSFKGEDLPLFVASKDYDDVQAILGAYGISHTINAEGCIIIDSASKDILGMFDTNGISYEIVGKEEEIKVAEYRLPDRLACDYFKSHPKFTESDIQKFGEGEDKKLVEAWMKQEGCKVVLSESKLVLVNDKDVIDITAEVKKTGDGFTNDGPGMEDERQDGRTSAPYWISDIDPEEMFPDEMYQIRQYPFMSPSSRGLDIYVDKESPTEKMDECKWLGGSKKASERLSLEDSVIIVGDVPEKGLRGKIVEVWEDAYTVEIKMLGKSLLFADDQVKKYTTKREAMVYPGAILYQEMMEFYQKGTPEEIGMLEKLLGEDNVKAVIKLLEDKLGIDLSTVKIGSFKKSADGEHPDPIVYDYKTNREMPKSETLEYKMKDTPQDEGMSWFQYKDKAPSSVVGLLSSVIRDLKEGKIKEISASVINNVNPPVAPKPTGGSSGGRGTFPVYPNA